MLRQFRQKRLLGGCGAYPSVRTLAAYSGSYWSSYLEICIRHYVRVWPNPVVRRAKSERQVSTQLSRSRRVSRTTGVGHEDAFPRPRLRAAVGSVNGPSRGRGATGEL